MICKDVQANDFAVVSVPALKGASKNFIEKVLEVDADLGVLISFLKKSFDKFVFPVCPDLSYVKLSEIVEVHTRPATTEQKESIYVSSTKKQRNKSLVKCTSKCTFSV